MKSANTCTVRLHRFNLCRTHADKRAHAERLPESESLRRLMISVDS